MADSVQIMYCDPSLGNGCLCEQCSFLYFRAGSRGNFEEITKNGTFHLNFPQAQHSVEIGYECEDTLPAMPRLRASAMKGCSFCGLLREALQRVILTSDAMKYLPSHFNDKQIRGLIRVKKLSVLAAYTDHDQPSKFAAISIKWNILAEGWTINACPDLYFKIFAYKDDPLAQYLGVAYPHPQQDILSAENIKSIQHQLDECNTSHSECARSNSYYTEPDILPTRLIEIYGCKEKKLLRLIDSKKSNLGQHIKFAALSYCWGTDPFLRTTRANLDEHMQNIPWSSVSADYKTSALPQSFRDLVDVCWELEIRYIWIDSLCIIQADAEDWAIESSRMHKVYMNAWVTIVFTLTTSPHVGLLARNEDTACSQPVARVSYIFHQDSGAKGSFFLQSLPQFDETYESSYLAWNQFLAAEDTIDFSGWNTRGWTLQERLLSIRKLYIRANDMFGLGYVSCQRKTDHTKFRERQMVGRQRESLDYALISALSMQDITLSHHQWTRLHDEWFTLVRDYSCRNLTVSADRLAAVSSIARVQQKFLGAYNAGLWYDSLPFGLLWAPRFVLNPGSAGMPKPFVRPSAYRAPSWSWCANDGAIDFIGSKLYNPTSEVMLLGWECVPEYAFDPFGKLAEDQGDKGYVRLLAKCRTLHMEARRNVADEYQKRRLLEIPGSENLATAFLDHSDISAEAQEVLVVLVLKGQQRPLYHGHRGSGKTPSAGLILQKSASHRPEYRRIGFYGDIWEYKMHSVLKDCGLQEIYIV
ncbi:hypothetical protein PT974_10768 [Cladobotryum mycophilum]|uniref:Heterokaryon incompatibility domain-containing protein n=1 Tax=Cladobotryum mycophilum TaxID=491253 RepID=A0ABR0SAT0_9HYPO